jgi:protein-S-isoprenylcysteine O-methyltransferase Ste14
LEDDILFLLNTVVCFPQKLKINFRNYQETIETVVRHEEGGMVESFVVTLLPVLFLIVLFGGGELSKRRNIDIGGEPPINKRVYIMSKYAIPLLWAVMSVQSWGVKLSFFTVPAVSRWIALFFWISGFSLLFIGRFGLGESFRIGSPKEQTSLHIDGLFRLSRNPMYLGVFATLLATVLYTMNPFALVIGIFIVAVHHKIVLAEEQFLYKAFGAEYAEYCHRVRRYI